VLPTPARKEIEIMRRNRFLIPVLFTFGLSLFGTGCGNRAGSASFTKNNPTISSPANLTEKLGTLETKQQSYVENLKSLSNHQLALKLASDAHKGREPFNSAAYKEALSRGKPIASELQSGLAGHNRDCLLSLMALKHVDADAYHALDTTLRVDILVDALKNAEFFNSWGIPHRFWEEPAQALIAEGSAATQPLEALLADKRSAKLWGPQGVAIDARFHYRVCDYAWALLHPTVPLSADPLQRDRSMGI
jgi:hypothetical protein